MFGVNITRFSCAGWRLLGKQAVEECHAPNNVLVGRTYMLLVSSVVNFVHFAVFHGTRTVRVAKHAGFCGMGIFYNCFIIVPS